MGRPPKPTSVLEFEKGKLYDEQRDRAELEPKAFRELKPRCPQRFTPKERKAWKDIAAILKNYGLFTIANAIQLDLLATAWVQYLDISNQYRKTCEDINKITGDKLYGIDPETKKIRLNPLVEIQQDIEYRIRRLRMEINVYSQNLGLSSVAMAKIGSLQLKKKKEKEEFFPD